jgi:Ca2+-transporting ATPase
MAKNALRVLAMAYKELPPTVKKFTEKNVELGLIFVGLQGMIDPPRKEAIQAVKIVKQAGIKNVMITGDHRLTAVAVAKELGILTKESLVLTGAEMDKMSDEEFYKKVEKVTVYARVSPMHKLRIVETLQKRGEHIVAMTGDGVNDAPALKRADIGVAMGITGTDVSKEASDMILTDDNYTTMVSAVEGGRHIFDNIRKYIRFLLSSNFDEILVIGSTAFLGLPIPFTPAQLLFLNLVTDGPPASALSVDEPEKDLMKKKPRDPKASVFDGMLAFIIVSFLCQSFGELSTFLYGYYVLGNLEVAMTMAFTEAVIFELFNAWNCRSETRCVWRMGRKAFKNKYFVLSIVFGFLLLFALHTVPFLMEAFNVVPLTLTQWAICFGFASTALFIVLPEFWMGRKIFKWK